MKKNMSMLSRKIKCGVEEKCAMRGAG